MDIHILTLFPNTFRGVFEESIIKRAQEKGLVKIFLHDLRQFGLGKHKVTDDAPYGGGAGMIMQIEPIYAAIKKINKNNRKKKIKSRTILLTPQGEVLNEKKSKKLAKESSLVLICGHYKGLDERIRLNLIDEEISVGDYVLSGGEIAAMTVVDTVVRLIPKVVGNKESIKLDSFYQNILEGPLYTRPAEFEGMKVPDILLSGNHEEISKWRRKEALRRTYLKRPELLDTIKLNKEDKQMLKEIKKE
ncbi:MAG: tRNA (guanosine(37)-N1)-methyltransferase TrmD [Candidatus Omnitrophica bacterium]|nr:tRNA (guanosine(37)-N1)-methyltransferase TrmD [Candidatus Omnitrophota bacterium]MBU1047818.1 tRNA (guanosine(37)-N1)-methyltransferase TrmD [Candidatus Omnitrophota bacterium]MBU1631205.1 tRNA (guanosine(37)-N1)-methyltransferase TrmD [Candidatus Omnitrophota bacterium]MBU1767213.1 tRNA (guanosine(37)-N1)-methyltransferase TrmD [Candidatus Omnitrophota bacterium]MBU1888653.1 tRNA (guanosine(37)-N1)-methyltransferase TrmD [Candidatus Omnitrophota bacterium]